MSESLRLDNILQDIHDRIKKRGVSPHVLWTNFFNGRPLTKSDFETKLKSYGIKARSNDIDLIWSNIEAKEYLEYSEFIRLLKLEKIDAAINSYQCQRTSYQPQQQMNQAQSSYSFKDILSQYRREIVESLLRIDSSCTGFVQIQQIIDCASRLSQFDKYEAAQFLKIYDQNRCNSINYFTLLSDLVNKPKVQNYISENQPYNQMPKQYQEYHKVQSYVAPPVEEQYSYNEPRSYTYDNVNNIPRGQPTRNTSYNSIEDIINELSSKLTTAFSTATKCFKKWCPQDLYLSAERFVDGSLRDFKMNFSIEQANEIFAKYGGKMSLSNFVKMVSDGADRNDQSETQRLIHEDTEEEKTLKHIARQAKGTNWKSAFNSVDTVENLVFALRGMRIYALLNDLRPAWEKYGKEEMMRIVDNYMQTL